MASTAAELLSAAMQLSTEERAELVTALLHTLDDTTDADAEEAWKVEIQRRLRQMETGEVELLDWETVRAELKSRLGR